LDLTFEQIKNDLAANAEGQKALLFALFKFCGLYFMSSNPDIEFEPFYGIELRQKFVQYFYNINFDELDSSGKRRYNSLYSSFLKKLKADNYIKTQKIRLPQSRGGTTISNLKGYFINPLVFEKEDYFTYFFERFDDNTLDVKRKIYVVFYYISVTLMTNPRNFKNNISVMVFEDFKNLLLNFMTSLFFIDSLKNELIPSIFNNDSRNFKNFAKRNKYIDTFIKIYWDILNAN